MGLKEMWGILEELLQFLVISSGECEVKSKHVDQQNSEGPHVYFRKVIHNWVPFLVQLLRSHKLPCSGQKSLENFRALLEGLVIKRCGIREVNDFGISKILRKHNVPWFEISMAVASGVHMCYSAEDLAKEVMCQIGIISSKLLHIVIQFTSFDTLNYHGIVDV